MQRKSIKLNTILNTFRMALTVLIPLITFPYTSRVFLTQGSGKINFSNSVVQVFTLFASLGIYSYGIREGAKVRNNRAAFTKLAHELFFVNIVSTAVAYIVFFFCVFNLPSFQNYRTLLLISSLNIGFTALGLDWIYGVYEEYMYITVRQIVVQLFTIVSMLVFVHEPKDIYLWAFLTVISSVGANIFNFIHARKYLDYIPFRIDRKAVLIHLMPILILFSTQLAAKVYLNLDTILLGVMTTDHNTGLYSAAVKLNTILITCFTAMSPVFVPRIVEYLKNDRKEEYYELLKKIFRLVLSLGIPAVVGIEMLGDQIIRLLAGDAFIEAGKTIRILAPIILITACVNILYYDVLVPNGKEKKVLTCTVSAAAVNLVTSCLLIPRLLQNGAAIGSIIAEICGLVLALLFCIRQDSGIKKSIPKITNYIIGSVGIGAVCFITEKLISNYIYQIILGIGLSVAVYALVLIITKDPMYVEAKGILIQRRRNVEVRRTKT